MEDETLEIEVDISRAVFQKVKRSPIDTTNFARCELNPRGDIAVFLKHIFGDTSPFRDVQSSTHSLEKETKLPDHRPYYKDVAIPPDRVYPEFTLASSIKMCTMCYAPASLCTLRGQSKITETPSANEEIKLRFTSDLGDLEITYEKQRKTHETYQTRSPAETEDITARNIIKISGRRAAVSLIINHPKFQEAVQELKTRDPTRQDGITVYDPITLPPRLPPPRPINRVGNNRLGTVSWPPTASNERKLGSIRKLKRRL